MTRLAFQLLLIILPFMMFALYRLATRDARTEAQKWPFAVLLIIGLSMSAIFYMWMWFREPRGQRTCSTPPKFENGKIVESEVVPCARASVDSRKEPGQ